MTVGTSTTISPAAMSAATFDGDGSPSSLASNSQQILFRKHKVLPHPRRDTSYGSLRSSRPLASIQKYDVGHAAAAYGTTTTPSLNGSIATDEAVSINSLPSSPRILKHYPKRLGSGGPVLPPTPPAHSRNSSTYSAVPVAATAAVAAAATSTATVATALPAAGEVSQNREISSTDEAKLRPAPPTTPTKQMSPPTPDVTPPYAVLPVSQTSQANKVLAVQPPTREHDSRTGSFTTAREQPSSGDEDEADEIDEEDDDEDDEDGHSTVRHIMPSAKTSQSTVRRYVSDNDKSSDSTVQRKPLNPQQQQSQSQLQSQHHNHHSRTVGLGLGLESSPEQSTTPRSRRDFVSFDGEWGSSSEDIVHEWDDNLDRNVAVRKRHAPPRDITSSPLSRSNEVVEDLTVPPTNATEALRSISMPQRILTFPSPAVSSPVQPRVARKQYPSLQPQPRSQPRSQPQPQPRAQPQPQPQQQPQPRQLQRPTLQQQQRQQLPPLATAAPINSQVRSVSDSSSSDKEKLDRRVSTMSSKSAKSTKSTVSTVVEAFLIDTPPQRRRTLRHVRKQVTLRDSSSDLSPTSSAPTSLLLDDNGSRQRWPTNTRYSSNGHESLLSTTTATSVSSRSARREVWKAGGIPVVVVPERLSSVRSSSREPSLRSTSSRRSKKSQNSNSRSQPPNSRDTSAHRDRDLSATRQSHSQTRGRRLSDSDGSAPGDQRTIDYPPVVPRRTSSLSAPTSRNASRSGSMTSESVQAHSALLESRLKEHDKAQVTTESSRRRSISSTRYVGKEPGQFVAHEHEPIRTSMPGTYPPSVPGSDRAIPISVFSSNAPAQVAIQSPQTPKLDHEDENDFDAQYGYHTPREAVHSSATVNHVPHVGPMASPKQQQFDHELNIEHQDHYRGQDYSDRLNRLDSRSSLDRHGDYLGKHLSPQNTPFSMASVDTATTHHSQAEVSEALAVNIYPHQNTSVLVVDHSNRPSDCSDDSQRDQLTDVTERSLSREVAAPEISSSKPAHDTGLYTTAPVRHERSVHHHELLSAALEPVTPPQPSYAMEDVDSPLRNPRIPPEPPTINEPEGPPGPPAINFIPATPSGLTPAPVAEEQRNRLVMDEEPEEKPRRSLSLVLKRAVSRGRRTEYGPSSSRSAGITGSKSSGGNILTRTLSLTRSLPRRSFSGRRSESVDRSDDSFDEDEPPEADKLHPLWRPASYFQSGEAGKYTREMDDEGETYRYPPIDNRPHRSISDRMKRTFAILPLEGGDDFYPATSEDGPERRTVRRTPSGNLRVVKHRDSVDSVQRGVQSQDAIRPYTAPEDQSRRKFWRTPSFSNKSRDHVRRDTASRDSSSTDANGTVANGVARSASMGTIKKNKILPNLGTKIGDGLQTIPRRMSERRREKRSNELRQKISGPQEVRDGVGEVIRHSNKREAPNNNTSAFQHEPNGNTKTTTNYGANHNTTYDTSSGSYDGNYANDYDTTYYDNCRHPPPSNIQNGGYRNNYQNSYQSTYQNNGRSNYTYGPARPLTFVSGH